MMEENEEGCRKSGASSGVGGVDSDANTTLSDTIDVTLESISFLALSQSVTVGGGVVVGMTDKEQFR